MNAQISLFLTAVAAYASVIAVQLNQRAEAAAPSAEAAKRCIHYAYIAFPWKRPGSVRGSGERQAYFKDCLAKNGNVPKPETVKSQIGKPGSMSRALSGTLARLVACPAHVEKEQHNEVSYFARSRGNIGQYFTNVCPGYLPDECWYSRLRSGIVWTEQLATWICPNPTEQHSIF